jgi:ABC-type Mn2+/Zn2+ transport system permease subunit
MWEMLSYPFFQSALIAGTLSAAMCALVGVYVLLKRIVFVGITLAQLASLGVAMALLVDVHPMIMALMTTLTGVACFALTRAGQRVPQEGVIGASYVMAAALGIICVAKNPVGEARNLKVLFGNILSVHTGEMVALAGLLAVLAIVHVVFYKEFLFASFDPETAQAQGINVRGWDLLLYLTIGLAIAFSIHSMGVLLVFALLLVPAMTARLVAHRMMALFALAIGFGVVSVPLGLYLAVRIDLPTGTAVAGTCVVMLLAVLTVRGLYRSAGRLAAGTAALMLAFSLATAGSVAAQDTDGERRMQELQQEIDDLRQSLANQQMRLPGALLLNPEMRVEGNFQGSYLAGGLARRAEQEGFSNNRFNLREVELGFRASVDPFAVLEAVISAQHLAEIEFEDGEEELEGPPGEVEFEEAHLTFARLPFSLRGKLGLMRTSFGEYNDDDPDEFPQIDPPNIITQLYGDEGEGWKEPGVNLNYQFASPFSERMTHVLWFGLYSGENGTAFHGGELTKPVWFTRFELFYEVAPRAGLELGLSFAKGKRLDSYFDDMMNGMLEDDGDNGNGNGDDDDNGPLEHIPVVADDDDDDNDDGGIGQMVGEFDSTLMNVHFEFDWRPPLYSLEHSFGFLAELFYSSVERHDGTLNQFGAYALTQYAVNANFAIGARFDVVNCPGFYNSLCANLGVEEGETLGIDELEDRSEWAFSPILTFNPSPFLTLRAQYKHTHRSYAENSQEFLLQALFIIGYERPDVF